MSSSPQQRRRHRRRSRRPDGGRGAGAGRRPRHRLRRDAVGRPQIPDGRARRAQSHAQRAVAAIPRALSRGDAASESRDRGVPAERLARLERGAGAADLCRLQRPGVSESVQGLALAAGMAAAAGFDRACSSRCATAGPAGTSRGRLLFQTPDGPRVVEARATVLALGGASWPRLGSDGAWVETLAAKGVQISPLRPANCGFTVAWSDIFRDRFEGQPLKGVALTFGAHTVRGEAIVTRTGIEGGAVYALSAELREAIVACRAGDAARRVAARSRHEGSDRAALGAEGQTVPVQFPAQGRATLARRDRLAAGGGQGIRHVRWRRCRRPISPA